MKVERKSYLQELKVTLESLYIHLLAFLSLDRELLFNIGEPDLVPKY